MTTDRYFKELDRNGGSQTVAHVKNVGMLMKEFAKPLKQSPIIYKKAGELHDAGKIFIPPHVLGSTKKLSEGEKKIIRSHPTAATGVIGNMEGLTPEEKKAAYECAWYHHAWYNGQFYSPTTHDGGYYKGMDYDTEHSFAGENIPLIARVGAIADGYDAMTSNRSYQKARTPQQALDIIAEQCAKGQYDYYLCIVLAGSVLGKNVKEFAQNVQKYRDIARIA